MSRKRDKKYVTFKRDFPFCLLRRVIKTTIALIMLQNVTIICYYVGTRFGLRANLYIRSSSTIFLVLNVLYVSVFGRRNKLTVVARRTGRKQFGNDTKTTTRIEIAFEIFVEPETF